MRFAFAPTDVKVGGFEIFPKGDYEISVKSVKTHSKPDPVDAAKLINWGIAISSKVVGGEHDGKPFYQRFYDHVAEAKPFTKQAVMALYGYTDEAEFNADFSDKDWGYDTETGELGEVWSGLVGRRAVVSLDIGITKKGARMGEQQQEFKAWHPLV